METVRLFFVFFQPRIIILKMELDSITWHSIIVLDLAKKAL